MTEPARITTPRTEATTDGALGTSRRVVDGDPARAARTERLITELAAHLGFRLADVRVHVDDAAARRTGPHGARGLMADGVIWLHPNRYDPGTASGRSLLAHEATHLAQRGMPFPTRGGIAEAETEAAAIAADFAEGRQPTAPTVALPDSAHAADTGAPAATLPETEAVTPEQAARDEADLDALVATAHSREYGYVVDRLDGLWVSDGDVEQVLRLLDTLAYPVARALVRRLPPARRTDLIANMADDHRRQHRQSVLACYEAATSGELARFGRDLFGGLELSGLKPLEARAAGVVLQRIPHATLVELLAGGRRGEILGVLSAPSGPGRDALAGEVSAALARERLLHPAAATSPEARTAAARLSNLTARLADTLRDPGMPQARDALLTIQAELPVAVTPTGRPGEPGMISPDLAAVVAALEDRGAIVRLVEALPIDQRLSGDLSGPLLTVLRHRPLDANLALLERLLTYTVFDWALFGGISGAEAQFAYVLVRQLPAPEQARWRRRDGGRWYARMVEHLPRNLALAEGFAGLLDEEDAGLDDETRRVRAAVRPEGARLATQLAEEIERRGVDAESAPRYLLRLRQLGDQSRDAVARVETRRDVVRRLDVLGYMDRIFAELPDSYLFSEDNRQALLEIALARDPGRVLRQARSLLSLDFLDWAVTAREAFLAFQLVRALPEADRQAFAAENGALWSRMLAEMTAEMRASSGIHAFVGSRTGVELEQLRDRLRVSALWRDPQRGGELRTVINMLIALGDHAFTFERSRNENAHAVPGLAEMVETFRLYHPRTRPTYHPELLRGTAWYQEGPLQTLSTLGGYLGLLLSLTSSGQLLVGGRATELRNLDLRRVQDIQGGDLGGVRLSGDATNRVEQLSYDPTLRTLHLRLPHLVFDSISVARADSSVRTGRATIRGVDIRVNFADEDLSRMLGMVVNASGADLADLLVTAPNQISGAARLGIGALGVRAGLPPDPAAQPARAGTRLHIPVPVLWPLLDLAWTAIHYFRGRLGPLADLSGNVAGAAFGLFGESDVTVSLSSLELDGLALGAEQVVRSVRVQDVTLGVGRTRPGYLRALLAALRVRRQHARDEATAADLDLRIAETVEELGRLEPVELRLNVLRRIEATRPGSLTPEQKAELRTLGATVGGGGAATAIGELTVEGVTGAAAVRSVRIGDVHGNVESPAFADQLATDEEIARRFQQRGQPAVAGVTAIPLRAETIEADELTVRGDIPTAASLQRELDTLPPHVPQAVRDQLAGLRTQVVEVERLEAHARAGTLTEPDRTRLRDRRDELRTRFGLQVDSLRLAGVQLDVSATSQPFGFDLSRIAADEIAATGVRYGGTFEESGAGGRRLRGVYEVGTVTARGVSGRLGEVLTPVPDRAAGARGAGFAADEFRAGEIRLGWAGNRIAQVGITGLAGQFEPLTETGAFRIAPLTAATADVAGVDYRTPDMAVRIDGRTTITGIALDAEVRPAPAGRVITVRSMRLDTVAADHIVIESTKQADGFRGEVTSGLGKGLTLTNFTIDMPAEGETRTTGRIGVGELERLRFAVATYALDGTPALRAGGELNTLPGTGQATLDIELLGSGGQNVDLRNLELTRGEVVTPDGRVHIRRAVLGGRVERAGNTTTFRDVLVPELNIARIDWRAGGARITANGRTVLSDLSVSGSFTSVPATETAPQTRTLHLDSLRIRRITSDDLRFDNGSFEIHLGRSGRAPDALDIRDIRLDDFTWTATGDTGSVTEGELNVGQSRAEFAGAVRDGLSLRGAVAAGSLRVVFHRGDRIVASAHGISGDLDVAEPVPQGQTQAQPLRAHVGFTGIETGEIDIRPDRIEVGAAGRPAFTIAALTVDELAWESAGLRVTVPQGEGGVALTGVSARARLVLGPAGTGIRRIVLPEMRIEEVAADGLRLDFLDGTTVAASVAVPAGETATLGPVRLAAAEGATGTDAEGFVLEPDATRQEWGANGQLLLSELFVPRLTADVSTVLKARAAARVAEISLGLFRGGRTTLDLTRPVLDDVAVTLAGNPQHTLVVYGDYFDGSRGLGAEHVRLDTAADPARRLTVTDAFGVGVRYLNRDKGVDVLVRRFRLPGETTVDTDTFAGHVPNLEIDLADMTLELRRLLAGDPGAAAKPDTRPFVERIRAAKGVVDSLNGQVRFHLFLPFNPWYAPDQDLDITVNLTNGHLDFERLQRDIHGGLSFLVDFELIGDELLLGINFGPPPQVGPNGMPMGDPMGEPLPPAVYDFVKWKLTGEELTRAQQHDEVALWRLIQPVSEGGGGDDDEEGFIDTARLRIGDMVADLSVRSDRDIPVPLGAAGSVVLAPDAVVGLHATALSIPGNGTLALSVGAVNVKSVDLHLGPFDVTTGAITVSGIDSGRLEFTGNEPDLFSALVTRATATDIRWQRPPRRGTAP